MKKIAIRFAAIAIGFAMTSPFAGELEALSAKITKNMPGLKIDSLVESPVPGLYEMVSGGDVAYVTADGVHLIQGTMFNVPEKKNVSEATLAKLRVKEMASIDKKSLIVFPAKGGKAKHTLTVFTDPSCPYCKRLHQEIPKLNEMGVTVQYALYARTGTGTLTSRQLSEIMCSSDKKLTMDHFFQSPMAQSNGAKCQAAEGLDRIARVGPRVGLKGTPHLVGDNGYSNAGFMPAEELVRALNDAS